MAAYEELLEAAAVVRSSDGAGGQPPSGVLVERCRDHLSISSVSSLFESSSSSVPGPRGERERSALRSVCGAFLETAAIEPQREIDERCEQDDGPEGGYELAALSAPTPADRGRRVQQWVELEASLADARAARFQARHEAAGAVGARSTTELLGAGHPVDPRQVLDSFGPGFVDPLDAAVEDASRHLAWNREPVSPIAVGDQDRRRLRADLVEASTSLGFDLRGRFGSRWSDARVGAWSELRITAEAGPVVVLGGATGPRGYRRGLGAIGRAVRAAFLRGRRGPRSRWSDPAFVWAADTLFRRLALSAAFESRSVRLEGDARRVADRAELRLDEALAPRLSWAYLFSTMQNQGADAASPPDERDIDRLLRRALGRPANPGELARALDADPRGASELRGTALGILLEDRLLTRFGRRWFEDSACWRFLKESWEAEPDETAESMAGALGLGTIEPTPVLDGCRP